jgi:quinol monooxygenase YgiN
MSKGDYEQVIGELEQAHGGEPEGRLYHAAYGEDEVHMFEIWESRQHFEDSQETLMAVLQGAGVGSADVQIHPLHSEHPD